MTKLHDDRVRAALTGQIRFNTAQCADLVAEQAKVVTALEKGIAEQRAIATDPIVPAERAREASDRMKEIELDLDRARAALSGLQKLHAEREAARPAILLEIKDAVKERDEIATEFAARYPELAGELADLLARIRASEIRLLAAASSGEAKVDLRSAEAVARGVTSPIAVSDQTSSGSIADAVTLPALNGAPLWPSRVGRPDWAKLPARLQVTNKAPGGRLVHTTTGPKTIQPGGTLTDDFGVREAMGLSNQPDLMVAVV